MNRMRLWASAAIIAVVILIAFALSVPHVSDSNVEEQPAAVATIPTVTLRDSFKKGVHTISGSLEASNACIAVSASAATTGSASSTEGILVTISLQSDSGVCLQVPTRMNFETTLSAPAALPITVTVNGSLATTTSS